MLTLELDLGLNTNVGDHADQKREFLLLRAENYEFSSNSVVLSGFHQVML
jgi:hypothetical protein